MALERYEEAKDALIRYLASDDTEDKLYDEGSATAVWRYANGVFRKKE